MVLNTDGASCTKMENNSVQILTDIENKFEDIIVELLNNSDVKYTNQQRGDDELTVEAKKKILTELMSTNKQLFLIKFGKFLKESHLEAFKMDCDDSEEGIIIKTTLSSLQSQLECSKMSKTKKNRRYQALQELIDNNSYFSESEMMKRNPLLYNELVGQYLTEEERRSRDRATEQETLVQILMEGIERDDARELRKKQVEMEDNAMEEEDSDEETQTDCSTLAKIRNTESPEPEAGHSRWGECPELADDRINHDEFYARSKTVPIGLKQKELLREEFITVMHESFLDGKDDFDYASVDDNERYDNLDIITQDEEDKYFDSEEPNDMQTDEHRDSSVSSEDELEIFMSRLQKSHPAVGQLSDDFKKL